MLEDICWAIVLADFIDLNPKKNLVLHLLQESVNTERSGLERKGCVVESPVSKKPLKDDSLAGAKDTAKFVL